jgi:hypothetical protein
MQLSSASFRALAVSPADLWGPAAGLAVFQILQGLGIIGGGVLAGIGQRRGRVFGAMVGALSGLLFLAGIFNGALASLVPGYADQLLTPASPIRSAALYGFPVLYTLCGAVGGWLGQIIWKPIPSASDYAHSANLAARPIQIRRTRPAAGHQQSLWDGPVLWLRVGIGAFLAVTMAIYTHSIIDGVVQLTEGRLSIVSVLEDQVAYAEVFSLAILFGGAIAGANTPNGLKQGMCVGIAAAFVIDGLFLMGFLNPSAPAIFPVLSTLFLGPIGGWFGSELLPPVHRGRARRRMTWDQD